MADITMCNPSKDRCPMRENCYRYNAEPDNYQAYFEPPLKDDPQVFFGVTCAFYIRRIKSPIHILVKHINKKRFTKNKSIL